MNRYDWERLARPLVDRIARLLRYGKLTKLNSEKALQQAQIKSLDGQLLDAVEVFEPYGFTSAAKADAEALVAQVGGQRGNEVVICIADRRYRLAGLAAGEVALFDDLGNKVHLTRSGIVVEAVEQVQVVAPKVDVAAAESVTVTTATVTVQASVAASVAAPLIGLTGNTTVTGTLNVTGALVAAGGLAVAGGNGATVQGSLTTTGGDISADGISLKEHEHGGVTTGNGVTGAPQ